MSKEKRMPKEYAIVVSLMIFFTIIIIVGTVRLWLSINKKDNKIDLATINILESDNNIELTNYNFKIANSIKDAYGIDIYFGDKLNLEQVNAVKVTDDKIIFNMLKEINNMLEVYPKGIIEEIESKGYEISIYLVDYFKNNMEALVNRNSIGQIKMYISNTEDINRALHHECYHILDYYIKLETDSTLAYTLWDKYNPNGFQYSENIDNITAKYVYKGEAGAYFVTAYAKYSEKEDRAETFAEMMTASKTEIFFNEEEPIRAKMDVIRKVLYDTFKSVRMEEALAWE